DIRRLRVPREELVVRCRQRRPSLVARVDVGIGATEAFAVHTELNELGELVRVGPEVREKDVAAVAVLPEGFVRQVHVDASCNRVSHDERWRGEIVRLYFGMDPSLE